MNKIEFACILALLPAGAMAAHFLVKVVDADTLTPLQGVKVRGWFSNDNGWKAWTESAPEYVDNEITDKNGRCKLTGKTNTGKVGFVVNEPPSGYYPSRNVRLQLPLNIIENMSAFFRDGPEELLRLDRIENPIPLYVRHAKAPRNNNNVVTWDGTNSILKYDFIVGDWLPPVGNGSHADIVIATHLEIDGTLKIWRHVEDVTFYDFISRIEFTGEGNGLCEKKSDNAHSFIKIRKAPETGYQHAKISRVGRKKRKEGPNIFPTYYDEYDKNHCYCFRIRSKFDDNGNLIEAYYGKVYGDFEIKAHINIGLDALGFLYYLNPTPNDRNLEWNMKNNLCPNPGRIGQRQP